MAQLRASRSVEQPASRGTASRSGRLWEELIELQFCLISFASFCSR
jgi:hypothetical protein